MEDPHGLAPSCDRTLLERKRALTCARRPPPILNTRTESQLHGGGCLVRADLSGNPRGPRTSRPARSSRDTSARAGESQDHASTASIAAPRRHRPTRPVGRARDWLLDVRLRGSTSTARSAAATPTSTCLASSGRWRRSRSPEEGPQVNRPLTGVNPPAVTFRYGARDEN